MNKYQSDLKTKVMNRVFRFWFLRSMAPLLLVEIIVIGIAIYAFANLIFINQVVDNALSAALGNPFKLIAYLWNSFLITRAEVKVVIIALVLVGLKLLRDVNRGIISFVLMKRA